MEHGLNGLDTDFFPRRVGLLRFALVGIIATRIGRMNCDYRVNFLTIFCFN